MNRVGSTGTVLRASAGSGKTERLSSEFLQLLRQGADPGEVLATTFSRKAAGEILGRVLQRLAEDESDSGRADLVRLVKNLHRVNICTVDSFFQRLARVYRWDLALPLSGELIDERSHDAALLRRRAVRLALRDAQGSEAWQALREILERMDERPTRRVSSRLDDLLSELHQLHRHAPACAWDSLAARAQPPGQTLDEAVDRIRRAMATDPLGRDAAKVLMKVANGRWSEILNTGLARRVFAQDGSYRNKAISSPLMQAVAALFPHVRYQLLHPHHRRLQAHREALALMGSQYDALRRETGLVLYSDIPEALLRLLAPQHPRDLETRIDDRIRHVLLDEFQDTSSIQWEILGPFCRQTLQRGGRFFCVGDQKQAIYGWRGATPRIFERLTTDLPRLGQESSDISYRSSQVVLDVVDRVMNRMGTVLQDPHQRDAAAEWCRDMRPHRAYNLLPGWVELVEAPDDSKEADDPEWDEEVRPPLATGFMDFAARRIRDIAQRGGSVGVLVRSNRTARWLMDHLRRLGVAASSEGGSSPDDHAATEIVLAALTLADHPGHTAAAFQLAHSPLAEDLGFLRPEARPTADEIRAVSQGLRARLRCVGLAELVAHWMHLLAPHSDARGIERLTQVLQLAESAGPDDLNRPIDFVARVRSTRLEEPAPVPVRVMTIHASKGLEFDSVVLPELNRSLAPFQHRPAFVPLLDEKDAIIQVYPTVAQDLLLLDPGLAEAHRQYARRQFQESLSLLYVAMTRARQALHFLIPHGTCHQSYAKLLKDILSETQVIEPDGARRWFRSGEPLEFPRLPAPAPAPARTVRLQSLRGRNAPEVRPSDLELPSTGTAGVTVSDLLALTPPDSLVFGEAIHLFLSRVRWLNEGLTPPDPILEAPRLRAWKREPDWLQEVWRRFLVFLRDPVVEACLTPSDEIVELWLERRFHALVGAGSDRRLLNGTFDRVVIHRDEPSSDGELGRICRAELIDWKTDAATPETLADVAARYRPQLGAYRTALSSLLELPEESITSRLVFVGSGLDWLLK